MDKQDKADEPKTRADDHSIAIGEMNIGGDVSGSILIGNTGYTSQEVSVLISQITATFQPKPFDGSCPYKGLDVFEEEDAELFFGREKLVESLVDRVKESRILFVTGPSGSGKSSLVRAGLIPAWRGGAIKELHSEHWCFETMKPGRDPLEALRLCFSRLKSPELGNYLRAHVDENNILNECTESALSGRSDQRFVLFIDQFEEVFTQINREEERLRFLNVLTNAVTAENGRVILVLAMRSDFVSNCAAYPELNARLNQLSAFAQIGSMQPEELVSAIAQPALRVGLRVDPDLIAQIINDMQGEPGALPLMQFALKDLFDAQQAKGGLIALTLDGYIQQGGIRKALERHADNAFARLSESEQALAHSIFSGLIEIGRGAQDTRRTALFDELVPAEAKTTDVEAVVRKLADARLIITDEQAGRDTVTISHEKLIDAWPWLKKLVNENREVIALQNEIAEDAKEWDNHRRDPSYLYSGARLINARDQLESKKLTLSGLAQEFVQAGRVKQQRSQVVLFGGIAAVMVLLLLAVIIFSRQASANAEMASTAQAASTSAVAQQRTAEAASTFAIAQQEAAQASAEEAHRQTQIARARELIAKAQLFAESDPQLALLLSIESLSLDRTVEADTIVRKGIYLFPEPVLNVRGNFLGFSPDGNLIVLQDNTNTLLVWDLRTRQQIAAIAQDHPVSINITSDNRLLVTDDARIWDITSGKAVFNQITVDANSTVANFILSPDSQLIATMKESGTIHFWDSKTGKEVSKVEGPVIDQKIVFSPDGSQVAYSSQEDGKYRIELLDTWSGNSIFSFELGRTDHVEELAFSDNGTLLFANILGDLVRVWNVETGAEFAEKKFGSRIQQLIAGDNSVGLIALDGMYLWYPPYDELKISELTVESAGRGITFIKNPEEPWRILIGIKSFYKLEIWTSNEGITRTIEDTMAWGQLSADGTKFVVPRDKSHSLSGLMEIELAAIDTRDADEQLIPVDRYDLSKISNDGNWLVTQNDYIDYPDNVVWALHKPNYIQQFNPNQAVIDSDNFTVPYSGFQVGGTFGGDTSLDYSCFENEKTMSITNRDTGFDFANSSETEDFRCPAIAATSDFEWLALGWDDHVTIWDTERQEKITELDFSARNDARVFSPGIESLAFSTDNSHLIAGGLDSVIIWDTKTWQKKTHLSFGVQLGQSVSNVALSHDGLWAVTTFYLGAGSEIVQIWDVNTGQEISKIENESIASASFAGKDDKYLKTVYEDGTIKLRLWKTDDLIQEGCAHSPRNFTRQEWGLYMVGEAYRATCPQRPLEPESTASPSPAP